LTISSFNLWNKRFKKKAGKQPAFPADPLMYFKYTTNYFEMQDNFLLESNTSLEGG
jgi:hypothetical protein